MNGMDPVSRHILRHIVKGEPIAESAQHRVVRVGATAIACVMPIIGVAPWVPPNWQFFAWGGWPTQVGTTLSMTAGFAAIDALAMYKLMNYYLTPKSEMRKRLNRDTDAQYRCMFHVYKVVSLIIAEMTRTPDIASGVLFVSNDALKIVLGSIAATTVFLPWMSIDDSIKGIHTSITDPKDVKRLKALRTAFIAELEAMKAEVLKLETVDHLLDAEDVREFLENLPEPGEAEAASRIPNGVGTFLGLYAIATLVVINTTLSYELCEGELDFPKWLAAIYSVVVVGLTVKFFADGFFAANKSHATDAHRLITKRKLPVTPASRHYPRVTAIAKLGAMVSSSATWGASAFFCEEYYGECPVFEKFMIFSGFMSLTTLCTHLLSTFTERSMQAGIERYGSVDAKNTIRVCGNIEKITEFVQTVSAKSFGIFLDNSAPESLLKRIQTSRRELVELVGEEIPLQEMA